MLSVYNMTGMSSREPEIFYISANQKEALLLFPVKKKAKLFCSAFSSYLTISFFVSDIPFPILLLHSSPGFWDDPHPAPLQPIHNSP